MQPIIVKLYEIDAIGGTQQGDIISTRAVMEHNFVDSRTAKGDFTFTGLDNGKFYRAEFAYNTGGFKYDLD